MYDSLHLGSKAPDFSLIGTDGVIHTLAEFRGSRAIIVMFLANQCPFVKASGNYLSELVKKYRKRGVAFIGINSNSEVISPEDTYEYMVQKSESEGFPYTYLHDSSQQIALKYGALVTPHFFLFDQNRALIYSGKGLDNPKLPEKSEVDFLSKALDEYLDSKPVLITETDPIGCSIKWEEAGQVLSKEACYQF